MFRFHRSTIVLERAGGHEFKNVAGYLKAEKAIESEIAEAVAELAPRSESPSLSPKK